MHPKLLKSFVVVLVFWMLATTVYWSFQDPRVNHAGLASLKALFPFLPFEVPAEVSILESLWVQKNVIVYWTVPLLLAALCAGLAGFGVVWAKNFRKSHERIARGEGSGVYRGVSLTLGVLPLPPSFPRDELELSADDEALKRMTEAEVRLLSDILGVISAAKTPYPGAGVTTSLLEHASNRAFKALTSAKSPGLSAIVAAAHELGKLTAYVQNAAGEWVAKKNQDREAARILGTLDSWYALPHKERMAVHLAVKYHSNPRNIPDLEGDPTIYRMARDLLSTADAATPEASPQEKSKPVDKSSLPDVIFETFLKTLPSLSFQSRGLPKGVAAVAWKVGARVYMIEIKLRETVMAKLPAEARSALTPSGKERQRLQPFTLELLKALEQRGWLVRQIQDVKLEAKEALWNIKAGKLDFKGVIVIDVPKDYVQALPSDDSMYEISVSGPLFTPSGGSQGGVSMSKSDLLSSVLRPSSAPSEGAV